jgi:hypothetical protein
MGKPNALKALDPMEFRFTDPDDIKRYGDGWFTYSEGSFLRLRARDLIELEGEMGTPMVTVMNGMRASTTLGDTAAAWLGVRTASVVLAGPFDDFNPITNLIEWRDAAEGKEEAPPEPAPVSLPLPDPDRPTVGPYGSTNSAPMDTVVLPSLPVAE